VAVFPRTIAIFFGPLRNSGPERACAGSPPREEMGCFLPPSEDFVYMTTARSMVFSPDAPPLSSPDVLSLLLYGEGHSFGLCRLDFIHFSTKPCDNVPVLQQFFTLGPGDSPSFFAAFLER